MSQRSRCGEASIRPFGCRDAGYAVIRRMLQLGLVIGLTSLLFSPASAQVTDRPPDTMEARLRACAACHGEQGHASPASQLAT
jgi:cytochrome c553